MIAFRRRLTCRSSRRSSWARPSSSGASRGLDLGAMRECTRRSFMKGGAMAVLAFGSLPRFLVRTAYAEGRGTRPRIVIAVFQRGAVDGLSMVVPHGDPEYYRARGSVAIARPAPGNPETALDLDGHFGLHPALGPLKALWD